MMEESRNCSSSYDSQITSPHNKKDDYEYDSDLLQNEGDNLTNHQSMNSNNNNKYSNYPTYSNNNNNSNLTFDEI